MRILLRLCTMLVLLAVPVAADEADTAEPSAEDITANVQPVLDPDVDAWIKEAYVELNEGRFENSILLFQKALRKESRNKRAWQGLGTVYIAMNRYDEAVKVMVPLVEAYPRDYFIKNNLAWLFATARDPAVRNGPRAVAMAQDALLLAPKDYHVWSTLAEAYYVSGKYEKATRAAGEALKLSRDQGASIEDIRTYERQSSKCEKAARAMSILE